MESKGCTFPPPKKKNGCVKEVGQQLSILHDSVEDAVLGWLVKDFELWPIWHAVILSSKFL